MAASLLLIGLIPELMDFNLPGLPPGLNAEMVHAGVGAQLSQLKELGYETHSVLIDLGETAEAAVTAELSKRSYDCVIIGAGIRIPAPHFLLFEKILNVVHRKAPSAAICFNTNPMDTADAAKRWV